jgi:hypothetical protein
VVKAVLCKLVSSNDTGEHECPDGSMVGDLIRQAKIPFDLDSEKVIRVHLPEDGRAAWVETVGMSDEVDYGDFVGYIIVPKTFILYEHLSKPINET